MATAKEFLKTIEAEVIKLENLAAHLLESANMSQATAKALASGKYLLQFPAFTDFA